VKTTEHQFTFPPAALAQHVAIVGKTGSGKTYAAKGIVEGLLAAGRRVCVLDPTGAWYGLRSSADGKKPGFPIAVFGGMHGDVPITEQSGSALAHILATKNLPSIIDLSELLIGQRHRFVSDFAEALYRENRTPLHLVIDEADEFCPQNPMPETKRMLHHVDRIVRRGRIRGFRVIMITQRPAVLHKNVLTQANTLVAMRLTAPQDRKAIQAWVEGQADVVQGKEVMDSLARLQRGEGWVWSPEYDVLERTTFPKITTFDSSRAPDENDAIAQPTKLAAVDIDEIRASFVEIEKEAKSLVELKAENAKLKRDLAGAQRDLARAKTVSALPLKHPSAPENNSRNNFPESELRKILALASKALADVDGGPRHLTKSVNLPVTLKSSNESSVARPALPSAGLSGPEQRILDAIAWMESIGVDTPEQPAVAFLAGYTFGAGGFNNPKGRLNQTGMVEYQPGSRIRLTDAGRAVANAPAAPATTEELHDRVLAKLPGPEQRILRPLLYCYPKAMPKNDLAHAAGYTPGAGGFNNPCGRLRSLGLIEYPHPGMCAARALLFPNE
jgi:hypothetical protein